MANHATPAPDAQPPITDAECESLEARLAEAERERDEYRACVEPVLDANKVLLKTMSRADRERDTALARVREVEAKLARIKSLADDWRGYGHGLFNVHLEERLPCSACDLLMRLDAALGDGGGK